MRLSSASIITYCVALLFAIVSGYLIATKGVAIAGALVALPVLAGFMIWFIRYPKLGVYATLILSFILPILARYVPVAIPFGLGIDALLVLTYVILIFKNWKRFDFSLAYNRVMLLMLIWMGYILFQVANPQAYSFMAWFYSMRGIALYQLLLLGLGFTIFNSKKDCYHFLNIWLGLSILGILWAMKQQFFGVSAAEQAWLDSGQDVTHVLFGKLRVFSYYYDAGTFGAAMGHTCILAAILYLGPYSRRRKIVYLLVSLFSFYALMLSGTRGALAVPAIGGLCYIIMIKNTRILMLGIFVLLSGFIFLKYTSIGSGNYNINRLRTALDPEDASLQVRFINRDRLTAYLADKPFGGGVGTTGGWGQRFSPGTWLAEFEPDGLYTRIRAETGLIGRIFYVLMWCYLLFDCILWVWKQPPGETRNLGMAFISGYAGILMANYGNQVMTQFPISLTTFLCISFLYSMRYWNEKGEVEVPNKETPKMAASNSHASSSWT
jgi:hypothetical protein